MNRYINWSEFNTYLDNLFITNNISLLRYLTTLLQNNIECDVIMGIIYARDLIEYSLNLLLSGFVLKSINTGFK